MSKFKYGLLLGFMVVAGYSDVSAEAVLKSSDTKTSVLTSPDTKTSVATNNDSLAGFYSGTFEALHTSPGSMLCNEGVNGC